MNTRAEDMIDMGKPLLSNRQIKKRATKKIYKYLKKRKGVVNITTLCPLFWNVNLSDIENNIIDDVTIEMVCFILHIIVLGLFDNKVIDESGNILRVPSYKLVEEIVSLRSFMTKGEE